MSITKFQAVKELRRRLGSTQQEFAQQTKLSMRTISVYELGKTAMSDGVLFRFARLAVENGYSDLAEILTPGQSIEAVIDVSEIVELLNEVKEAQQTLRSAEEKLRKANDKLTSRLNQKGLLVATDRNGDLQAVGNFKGEGKDYFTTLDGAAQGTIAAGSKTSRRAKPAKEKK